MENAVIDRSRFRILCASELLHFPFRGYAGAGLAACVVLAFLSAPARSADAPATQPAAPSKWAQHYIDRVAEFRRENRQNRNIVFVGSSHVEGFDAAKLLPGRRIVNRGIIADRIGLDGRGVLGRLDESVFDCNPGFILLENGVNDLGELLRTGKPDMDRIEACYRKVVQRIRTRLPDVPLVIIGLFPTRDKYADLKPLIVEFNGRLARTAKEFDCPFMEVYKPLANSDGLLKKEFSRDGLHLNPSGYRVWAELIERQLPSRQSGGPADASLPETRPATPPR
jgi:lysophospholipase L1-like esterase